MLTDDVVGGLRADLERAIEEPEAEGVPRAAPDALRALSHDLGQLGWFGALVAASDAPPPADDFFDDIVGGIRKGLDGEEDDSPLAARIDRAIAAYERSRDTETDALGTPRERTPRRRIAEALYEHFALDEHALFVEDVERVLELLRTGGAASDTKAFVRGLTRLSSDAARFIVGLFPGNVDLVYAIGNRNAERSAIEAVFDDFAPPAIWKRLPAIMNALIQKDKRFRLAITLWARLRGVAIRPEHIRGVGTLLEARSSTPLLERLLAHTEQRSALLAFEQRHRDELEAIARALAASGPTP